MRSIIKLCFIVALLFSSSCINLSHSEKESVRELKGYGIKMNARQIKNPGTAGVLNILPGFGNFYLATGTEESSQWLFGFMNLLLWPISPIWGVPQGVIDANTMNARETIYYYKNNLKGKQELSKIKAKQK